MLVEGGVNAAGSPLIGSDAAELGDTTVAAWAKDSLDTEFLVSMAAPIVPLVGR